MSLLPSAARHVIRVLLLAALVAVPAVAHADGPPSTSQFAATVLRNSFTQPAVHLAHNVPDLRVTSGDAVVTCGFLSHYESTGNLIRWGFATSEVLEERQGTLTQYYQRGVVDCHRRDGAWRMERRLAWDYLGGGVGGSIDLGVEPDLLSAQPGDEVGPWGHRVSNFAVDGTPIGFLDFFDALGGVQAFGFPKSDARSDLDPRATLAIPGANPNFIRQYFQAAVLEFHPRTPQPVKLRLLGDDVRNILYPDNSHLAFPSFNPAEPLTVGQPFRPHGLTERAILAALYQATGGPGWANSENWLSDAPLNDWHGVSTAPDGRVVALALPQNRLQGNLAVPLERLPHLQHLNLAGNDLQGRLPAALGRLTALSSLDLSANQFGGDIPAELGRLSQLTVLNLSGNQFTGPIPGFLGGFHHLTVLNLHANQLVGNVPPAFGHLPNLQELRVSANFLNGCLDPALRRIPSHDLGELVERFCDEVPDIAHTTAASDRAALEAFYYATGGPAWNNSNLWLSSAPLQAWHGVWANEDGRVTSISLKNNNLRGVLPSRLGDLAYLRGIEIRENKLRGVIPPGLGRAKELDWLNLSDNQMEGTIPDSLQGLTKFRRLSLDNNSFEGEIPAWLGNFPRLRDLHLRNNQFRGRIPASLGNIPALDNLILSNNQLEGQIPASLGNPLGLTSLKLSGNQLTGQIPPEIGRIGFLSSLQLDRNRLSGQIPAELGHIHNLSSLNLSNNDLHGEIPATFSGLKRLYRLWLGNNRLSGEIPAYLGNPVELRVLDLSNNQFTGTIPANLSSASKLNELRLSGNQLTGPIPPELGRLFHLTDLTLHTNGLQGLIPAELGNLTQLTQLTLDHNQLTGDIPPALIRLLNLETLSLSGNALTGCLPVLWREIRQHDLPSLGLRFCDEVN
ncbi:MAG: hypothetical protein OXG17_03790 [Chloroflexi bacterium]|nr:hypothetical protein [Chloroflexota bacterium]